MRFRGNGLAFSQERAVCQEEITLHGEAREREREIARERERERARARERERASEREREREAPFTW